MTTGKTIALTIQTFVSKVMSLLFNTLSRFVRAFLPRSKCLSISWLQSPSAVILEPKKIKSVAASTFPPVSPRMKWWNWIRTPAKTLSAYNTWISRCWQFESVSCKYKLVLLSNRCLGICLAGLAGFQPFTGQSRIWGSFLTLSHHIPSGPHQMLKKPTATCLWSLTSRSQCSWDRSAVVPPSCSSGLMASFLIPFFHLRLFFCSFTASTIKSVAFTMTCRTPLQSGPAHLSVYLLLHSPATLVFLKCTVLALISGICMTCSPGQEASPQIFTPPRSVTQTSPPLRIALSIHHHCHRSFLLRTHCYQKSYYLCSSMFFL